MIADTLHYSALDFLVGVIVAIAFYAIIQIEAVARLLVALLALALTYAVFLAPGGPAGVAQELVSQLSVYATTGLLAGTTVAKLGLALFDAVHRKPSRRRRRR